MLHSYLVIQSEKRTEQRESPELKERSEILKNKLSKGRIRKNEIYRHHQKAMLNFKT